MAPRRARPAARAPAPARRVASLPRERSAHSGDRDGLCPGAGAFRMGRGEEHPDRIPLCCERSDSLQDLCGRTGRPIAGGHSGECHTGGRGIAAADAHHTDRFRPRGRSHRAGLCSEPRATRHNITGFSVHEDPILEKWLQLLKEVAPSVTRIAVIFNPDTAPFAPLFNRAILAAAPSLGMTVTLARVHDDSAIEETIAAQAREPGGGLIMLPESFTFTHAM